MFIWISYSEDLHECETKESQRWRNTSPVIHRINLFVLYIPKLTTLKNYLENYSMCERHYNQIIVNDVLLNKLKKRKKMKDQYTVFLIT